MEVLSVLPGDYPTGHVKTALQYSAGGVVYRLSDGAYEVLLTMPSGRDVWSLPKGLIEPDESTEEAALREVAEETGTTGAIETELGQISYWYLWKETHTLYKKTVTFYLMGVESKEIGEHDSEVAHVRWTPLDHALKLLSYQSEREILSRALEVLRPRNRQANG